MLTKQKSLTERAAAAVIKGGFSLNLIAMRKEITFRIDQVDAALETTQPAIEKAEQLGDLDAIRAIHQSEVDLKDERRVLCRQGSDLYQAIKVATGREAMEAASQHRKDLEAAVQQARKAQEILAGCHKAASELLTARRAAAHIGESLILDADNIQYLAMAIHPEGNERKQLMIDLGFAEARHAQRLSQAA